MYGEKATDLIRSITREQTDVIPPYQTELIEAIKKENDELYAENLRISQSALDAKNESISRKTTETNDNNESVINKDQDAPPEIKPEDPDGIDIGEKEIMVMQVRHTAKLWNKRCIIAYHYERLNRLKRLRWEIGNNLPQEIVDNLSKEELEWFTRYNENLFSYMNALNDGRGMDLTLYKTPPRKLYIQVKCLKDFGLYDLGDGQTVWLKKDHIHNMPLSQCEKLIHQGVLEQCQ